MVSWDIRYKLIPKNEETSSEKEGSTKLPTQLLEATGEHKTYQLQRKKYKIQNTKYFQAVVKVKHLKKRTVKFITKNGNILEDQEQRSKEISNELRDCYLGARVFILSVLITGII